MPRSSTDSIYKLAVKPSAYPENSFIYLLDDGVVSVSPDGRSTQTYRQVIEMLKPEAVEQFRERSFSYSPGHQKMTINWLRVIRANGEVVEHPSQIQDADVPATMGDPVYSDAKVRRASLTGLEPGALLDYSVTTEELKPFLRGDFYLPWSVTTGVPTMRSYYAVDFPASFNPRIKERNLSFKRVERINGDRKTMTWATSDVPVVKPEAFAADSDGVRMSVGIAAPISWSDITKWYADSARGRYTITPALAAKISELVKPATTLEDSIRAIHKWVAQDIRYVSIALGIGGYQPRTPETVVQTGFGDCKDKATLFIAALRQIGVTAYPVLLDADGGIDADLPSIEQLDHVIAAIKRANGYEYVDMTAELVPLGTLPFGEQGEIGFVVRPDGGAEQIRFPKSTTEDNRMETRVTGSLDTAGVFAGQYAEYGYGAMQEELRSLFENPLDSAARVNVPREIAGNLFQGAMGDSLLTFDGKDLSAIPSIRFRISSAQAAVDAGNSAILTIPFGSMGSMATLAQKLAKEPKRLLPIDVGAVVGREVVSNELLVTLPDGWTAVLPPPVSASSAFGSYASEYTQKGRELRVAHRLSGTSGTLPPQRIGELIDWLAAVGKDNPRFIVLNKTAQK